MGVHGNGMTSLVWINPSPRATVIEFFYPGGFAHDYEYTTRALGMTYYGVWGNQYVLCSILSKPSNFELPRTFTSSELPPVKYPEGFQGNDIPIDGSVVAALCQDRIRIKSESDD